MLSMSGILLFSFHTVTVKTSLCVGYWCHNTSITPHSTLNVINVPLRQALLVSYDGFGDTSITLKADL